MTSVDFSRKTVEMIDVVKKFGDFTANDRISLTVHRGEVHALLGSGVRRKLLTGLEELDQALFVEQEIEAALGIRDRPMAGEVELRYDEPEAVCDYAATQCDLGMLLKSLQKQKEGERLVDEGTIKPCARCGASWREASHGGVEEA